MQERQASTHTRYPTWLMVSRIRFNETIQSWDSPGTLKKALSPADITKTPMPPIHPPTYIPTPVTTVTTNAIPILLATRLVRLAPPYLLCATVLVVALLLVGASDGAT